MRLRTTVISAGIALVAAAGISTPVQASEPRIAASPNTSWKYIWSYKTKFTCIDMGQQYEREGWNTYKCVYEAEWPKEWALYIA
jgi:hypothetical protein